MKYSGIIKKQKRLLVKASSHKILSYDNLDLNNFPKPQIIMKSLIPCPCPFIKCFSIKYSCFLNFLFINGAIVQHFEETFKDFNEN